MSWSPPNATHPPPKPDEPLFFSAVRTGDHETIRRLLNEGTDVEEVFNIRLDPGARAQHATPLMVAAGSGDGATLETVRLLVDAGADPTRVVDSDSAASMAAEGLGWNYRPGGDAERLEFLLGHGSPLPPNPARRNRVLCHAAESGDVARLKVLLDHGMSAAGHWDPEEAKARQQQIVESMRRTVQSEKFRKKLSEGANEVIDDPLDLIEEMYSEPDEAPAGFEIPLFCAAGSGSAECVSLLLEHGADPKQRDSSKQTALYSAISKGVVQTLMNAGVPIEDTDKYGWSPLANAVSNHEEGIPAVEALIACGADVNATHDRGYTVFMSAVGSDRHPRILRMLIDAGADPHAITELGYNAFHAAIDVNGEANLEESVRETYGYLKELGVDIEHRNNEGETPLARAISWGNGVEARVLCELGADPNVRCRVRQCGSETCEWVEQPLLVTAAAAAVGSDEKVIAMLAAGADPLVRDGDGFTALQRVVAHVCEDAESYETAFRDYYEGLYALRMPFADAPADRKTFIDAIRPTLRDYAITFATDIPVSTDRVERLWRKERLACIEHLAAHEAWHRRQDSAPLP